MEQPEDTTISGAEFARRVGVSRSAITRWVSAGKLTPATNEPQGFKSNPRYRVEDVERIKEMMRESGLARRRATALT